MALANVTELLVEQDDPRVLRFHSFAVNDLKEGEVLISIDKFGLTANNISYIATGKVEFLGLSLLKFRLGEANLSPAGPPVLRFLPG